MRALRIKNEDKILIIAPHPDDECIGPGGILLEHASNCDVIVLTDGRQGQGDIAPSKLKEIRKKEFVNEMQALMVHSYKLLDIPDGTLLSNIQCLENIELEQYDLIFVTGEADNHIDHKAAFLALEHALKKRICFKPIKCYAYEVHAPLTNPTHFYDVTSIIHEKMELVRIHESQIKDLPYDVLVEKNAAYRACLFRMPQRFIEVYEELNFDSTEVQRGEKGDYRLYKEKISSWMSRKWIDNLLEDKLISEWLINKKIATIYIYGYGNLGKLLIKEIERENEVQIEAIIDRRAGQFDKIKYEIIEISKITKSFPVLITAIDDTSQIEEDLKRKGIDEIYLLRDILEEL